MMLSYSVSRVTEARLNGYNHISKNTIDVASRFLFCDINTLQANVVKPLHKCVKAQLVLNFWRNCRNFGSGATTDRFLANKVALVTGSTSGIGLGIATALAKRGCDLVLTGLGDAEAINGIRKNISSTYDVKVAFGEGDFTKVKDIETMHGNICKTFPNGIDILINNAGFQHVCPVHEFPTEKWDAMIAVMLTAPFHLIRLSLPNMRKKGWGRVINIGSVHGVIASPYKSAYIAAKHGIVGLTKNVALETAGQGITSNVICPGYVDTPLYQQQVKVLAEKEHLSYEEAEKKFLCNVHPSGKSVGVDEVAELAIFLCTKAASQITGTCQLIDGGWTTK